MNWIWVEANDLRYLGGWKSFIPFGNSMKVLPSQSDNLVRNFEILHRELGWMDWAHLWYPWVIYPGKSPCKIAAQKELEIKHFLCKISEKAETCIGSCAQFLNWWTWGDDGTSDYIARKSSTIYVGIVSAIKIVVPLEIGRNAILALNRKRQFSLFNYGQYICQGLD